MKNVLLTASAVLLVASNAHAQWTPPIGIPMPSFGVNETPSMYSGNAGYQSGANGPFTHYVDNTQSNCVASGTGTPAQPLCNIPRSVTAGQVVEVHGGPYTSDNDIVFSLNGTQSQPAFIRGVDDGSGFPEIRTDTTQVNGRYGIFENFELNGSRIVVNSAEFVAVRRVEVHEHGRANGSQLSGTNLVLMNSHIHHNQGNDRHGTFVGSGSSEIWIVDNEYNHNGGDGIQFCHGCAESPPHHVYIGRNTMHSDRENGIDLKYSSDVIASENVLYSYRSAPADQNWCFDDGSGCGTFTSGSDGAAIVIGSDGGPRNVWLIANEVYDSVHGIRIEEGYEVRILGNILHGLSGKGVVLEKTGMPVWIANNTIDDVSIGIDQSWREDFDLTIHNNIISNARSEYVRFESGDVSSGTTIANNLLWSGGGSVPLMWNRAATVVSTADLNSALGAVGNIVGDPEYVDRTTANYRLRSGSAAIDVGANVLETYENEFRTLFSGRATLLRDADAKNRPLDGDNSSGAAYDIGAYEFGGGVAPRPPTGISVK